MLLDSLFVHDHFLRIINTKYDIADFDSLLVCCVFTHCFTPLITSEQNVSQKVLGGGGQKYGSWESNV